MWFAFGPQEAALGSLGLEDVGIRPPNPAAFTEAGTLSARCPIRTDPPDERMYSDCPSFILVFALLFLFITIFGLLGFISQLWLLNI